MKKIFISIFSTLLVLTGFAQNIHQRGGGTATDTCLEVGFTRKANIISAPNKTAKFVTLTDARGVEMKITVDSFATGGGAGYTNLTQFVDQTAWRSFYSNGSGDITELAFGTSGQVLTSNGASSAPTWQTPSSGSGTINSGTGFKIPFTMEQVQRYRKHRGCIIPTVLRRILVSAHLLHQANWKY